jgi:4a-hydroxytetrahydrobiopterin dehydratase
MSLGTISELKRKKCQPCEGGVPPVTQEEAQRLLRDLPAWTLTEDGIRIRRQWVAKNFTAAIDFFKRVADLAEQEGHHPDLHLTAYRSVVVELWTHAIGGLSENDFITAAKIEELPIEVRSSH